MLCNFHESDHVYTGGKWSAAVGSFVAMIAKSLCALTLAAGWMALAYLGYWMALLLDSILLPVTLFPALGAPVEDWRLTPFLGFIRNGAPDALPISAWARVGLPLALQCGMLAWVVAAGSRFRSAVVRGVVHQAALWTILFLAQQAAFLAALNRGDFAFLHDQLVPSAWNSPASRIAVVLCVSAALLVTGVLIIRRLLSDFVAAPIPSEAERWASVPAAKPFGIFLLVFSVTTILLGQLGFRINWLGTRWLLFFLAPSLFCLLLALLSLIRFPRATTEVDTPVLPLHPSRAVASLALAAALYIGLAQAQDLERWLLEREWAAHRTSHYEILYDPARFDTAFIRRFAEEREGIFAGQVNRLRFVSARLVEDADSVQLRIYLYPDLPSKRIATGSDRPFSVEGSTVRALMDGRFTSLDPAADAAALLHALWGAPRWPQGARWIARLLAGDWRGRSVEEWTAQITSELGHHTLADLFAEDSGNPISPLDREPLGAAWIRLVFDRYGLGAVRNLYAAQEPAGLPGVAATVATPAESLEADWFAWCQQLRSMASLPLSAQRSLPVEFFRGISFSHEGWGGRRGGYTGPQAEAQLRRIRSLGANAIAVIPYGFQREDDVRISTAGADETDEELIQALHTAHALGLQVMLKPQIWIGGGTFTFTGNLRYDDPARRADWMRSYRAFILHYARLAELEGFDLLCIGNELGGMTEYAAEWRRLIAEIRRVYHGPITYAANWGEEFESLKFWDALDYIGLNNYYPLRRPPQSDPSSAPARLADLLPGAQALAEKVEAVQKRARKPVIFTEVGYPSVRGGASRPWIESRASGVSLEEQAAAYEAVFQAFSSRPWLRGMFWWKWPSNGRGGGPNDPSFTPFGKPAAAVLQAWYTRMANGQALNTATEP